MPKVAITSRELAPTELPLFTELPLRRFLGNPYSAYCIEPRHSGEIVSIWPPQHREPTTTYSVGG